MAGGGGGGESTGGYGGHDLKGLTMTTTPGWRLGILMFIFAAAGLAFDTINEKIEKRLMAHPGLLHIYNRLKTEVLLLFLMSFVLSMVEGYLVAYLCIAAPEIHADIFLYSPATPELVAEASHKNDCLSQGKLPFWSMTVLHKTHFLVFIVAGCQILYLLITLLICSLKIARWRKWELAAAKKGDLTVPVDSWVLVSLGSTNVSHAFYALLGLFREMVTESVYINVRQVFIRQMGYPQDFDYLDTVSHTLQHQFVGSIKYEWIMWGFAGVLMSIAPRSGGIYIFGSLAMIAALLVSAKLTSAAVHLAAASLAISLSETPSEGVQSPTAADPSSNVLCQQILDDLATPSTVLPGCSPAAPYGNAWLLEDNPLPSVEDTHAHHAAVFGLHGSFGHRGSPQRQGSIPFTLAVDDRPVGDHRSLYADHGGAVAHMGSFGHAFQNSLRRSMMANATTQSRVSADYGSSRQGSLQHYSTGKPPSGQYSVNKLSHTCDVTMGRNDDGNDTCTTNDGGYPMAQIMVVGSRDDRPPQGSLLAADSVMRPLSYEQKKVAFTGTDANLAKEAQANHTNSLPQGDGMVCENNGVGHEGHEETGEARVNAEKGILPESTAPAAVGDSPQRAAGGHCVKVSVDSCAPLLSRIEQPGPTGDGSDDPILATESYLVGNNGNVIRSLSTIKRRVKLHISKLFWWGKPKFILRIFHLIYFENSLSLALIFFCWAYRLSDGDGWIFHHIHRWGMPALLILDITLLIHNAWMVLPMYALITPIGTHCPEQILERAQVRSAMQRQVSAMYSNNGSGNETFYKHGQQYEHNLEPPIIAQELPVSRGIEPRKPSWFVRRHSFNSHK